MGKQVLSVEQMQHLKELGLQLGETTFYWAKPKDGEWVLSIGNTQAGTDWEFIPAYTLQDILGMLPELHGNTPLTLRRYAGSWRAEYFRHSTLQWVWFVHDEAIGAAYYMLCHCIEKGVVETNKAKE